MGFADRYVWSLQARQLQDNGVHHTTAALTAAALADLRGAGFGALLLRVKYGSALPNERDGASVSAAANLAQLLRIWTERVTAKGRQRRWVRENTAWDAQAALSLYRRVAERSLAHWLDGQCSACKGAGQQGERGCQACEGSGRAAITGGMFEREKVRDMISELEGLMQAHSARAARRLASTAAR